MSVNVGVEMFLKGERSYLKRAFSAPRIWTVEAGYLARLVNDPACDISLAPTCRGGGRESREEDRVKERVSRVHGKLHKTLPLNLSHPLQLPGNL